MLSKNLKVKKTYGNCYKDFPEFYDLLYKRYFRTIPTFVELVRRNTPRGGLILDIAAGTGAVTIPLLKKGYKVISLDMHKGMLAQLKKKVIKEKVKNYQIIHRDMNSLNFNKVFDTICIRQAINYYRGPKLLKKGLTRIYKALKDCGVFIFNAPNYRGKKTDYPIVQNHYKERDINTFVLETNKLKGRLLSHRQDAIIWQGRLGNPIHISDTNSFYMFTRGEFEKSLLQSGFSKIKFYSSGLSSCKPTDKTLNCVAKK